MLLSLKFSMELLRKCKNNDYICLFLYINIFMSLRISLNPWPGGHGFKDLPVATSNVNAFKNMYGSYSLSILRISVQYLTHNTRSVQIMRS